MSTPQSDIDWDGQASQAKCDSCVLAAFRTILRELRMTRDDAEIRELLDDELSVLPGVSASGRKQ